VRLAAPESGLFAARQVELPQDLRDVVLGRFSADPQALRDLGVAQPFTEQLEDFELAGG
jgi:hypothetical protein